MKAIRVPAFLVLLVALTQVLQAQDVISESPYVLEGGILKNKRVVVSFKEKVISAPAGTIVVDFESTPIQDNKVSDLIKSLSNTYGPPTIRKRVPNLVWGDTIVINKRTQQQEVVPEMSQLFSIDFPVPVPLFEILVRFRALSAVDYAEPPVQIRLCTVPNDALYQNNGQWNLDKVNAASAWNITTGLNTVKLAVIDGAGGINPEALTDLAGRFVGGDGQLSNDHFIYVSGVAGAKTNNLAGIAGLGWNISLMGYHMFNDNSSTIEAAIDSARRQGADVMNFSLLTIGPTTDALAFCVLDFPSVRAAINRAHAAGIILVAAWGNNDNVGCGGNPFTPYPAAYNGVIGVTGTNQNDEFASSSWNYGEVEKPVVCAPAWEILTTDRINNSYAVVSGTSFSSPLVAALAALIFSINPDFTTSQVKSFITQTAQDLGTTGRDNYFGYGRINAYKALSMANGNPSVRQINGITVHPENGNAYPQLNWTLAPEVDVQNEGHIVIERRTKAIIDYSWTAWTVIATPAGNATQYIDYGIARMCTSNCPDSVQYRIRAQDYAGLYSPSYSSVVTITAYGIWYKEGVPVAETPGQFRLLQCYPNPFNPYTQIVYELPSDGITQLNVFDVLGREVASPVNEFKPRGLYTINFDGSHISSGLYVYRLVHNGNTLTRKMLLTK